MGSGDPGGRIHTTFGALLAALVAAILSAEEGRAQAPRSAGEIGTFEEFSASGEDLPSRQTGTTDLAACYGERLEVMFVTYPEREPWLRLSLPDPERWLVEAEPGTLLQDLPCREEAIVSSSVAGMFNDPPAGARAFPLPGIEGVGVKLVRLTGPVIQDLIAQSEAFFEATYLREGVELPDGFVHRVPIDGHSVAGGWLFPESYPSPIGTRIHMLCAALCTIEYRLTPELSLMYQLSLEGAAGSRRQPDGSLVPPDPATEPSDGDLFLPDAPPDWIAIDRAVRTEVLNWIEEL